MVSLIDDYWSSDQNKKMQKYPPLPPSPEPELYTTIALIYYSIDDYNRVYDNPLWIDKITHIEELINQFYPVVTCCVKNPYLFAQTHKWIYFKKHEFIVSCDQQNELIPYNKYKGVFGTFANTTEYFIATTHTPVFDQIHELIINLNRLFSINGSLNICLMSSEPVDDKEIANDWYLSKRNK
jgi:hypothetical protein